MPTYFYVGNKNCKNIEYNLYTMTSCDNDVAADYRKRISRHVIYNSICVNISQII